MELTRVNNDINGNPRYVCHFTELINDSDRDKVRSKKEMGFNYTSELYAIALKKSRVLGGRKYHNKSYGGGIAFQSYNEYELEQDIKKIQLQ